MRDQAASDVNVDDPCYNSRDFFLESEST